MTWDTGTQPQEDPVLPTACNGLPAEKPAQPGTCHQESGYPLHVRKRGSRIYHEPFEGAQGMAPRTI